ncbi:hypothetical protein [Novosphingobium terrae]|uniref:hypothetical protein n=1 Tax=Novosphingobium terrae TaxID=2726189 RepID=UPI0019806960|nr:hypothetical protein [Novosphingobium terrae]
MVDFAKKACILHAFDHASGEAVAVLGNQGEAIRRIAKRRKAEVPGNGLKRQEMGKCRSFARRYHGFLPEGQESRRMIDTGSVHHQHPC